jgi:uncharacterized tellurite resistance protein B-like protein
MSILKWLGLERREPADSASDAAAVRRISEALDRLDPERARYLAAFAYLLSRTARADLDVSDVETREMERIVMAHGSLPEDQAVLVVQIAKTQARLLGGSEDFLVAREFAAIGTREQKLALLDCLFAVSSADEAIATVEDNEIARIARELRIEHRDFIAVRARFRQHLNVLKPPDGEQGSGGRDPSS